MRRKLLGGREEEKPKEASEEALAGGRPGAERGAHCGPGEETSGAGQGTIGVIQGTFGRIIQGALGALLDGYTVATPYWSQRGVPSGEWSHTVATP
jgi:hypothetical protein